ERHEVADNALAIDRQQTLFRNLAQLRRVEAHPDTDDLRPLGPELEKFLQVTRPYGLLARDRAMDRDLVALDVPKNPAVRGGRSARIVFRLEAVDRHDDHQLGQPAPFARDLADRARHELDVNVPAGERRQDLVQLAVADQRLAADDRDVH